MKFSSVGILGAGKSGLAAAGFLRRLGARVLLSEREKIAGPVPTGVQVELGRHSNRLLDADLIIRSPGVPGHLPILAKARARGIPVWSELELASRFIRPHALIAITGTNGKTTTTTLVGELFKSTGRHTLVAGNIGTPLSAVTPKIHRKTTVVLEVSSYQLENIERFHPTISAILNITPDHLEHHGTMAAYAAAKARIFENQSDADVCVLNADDPWCRKMAGHCRARVFWFSRKKKLKQGVYFSDGDVVVRWGRKRFRWPLQWDLPGPHNIENAMAAVAISVAGGVASGTIRRVFKNFRGVEHRLELVRTLHGVRYINDSKATNVDSTRVALASFEQPLIIIMGGEGKGAPYAPLKSLVKKHSRCLLLIGEDADQIRKELGGSAGCEKVRTMSRAVKRARQLARPGDVVLLSPACASFDQYKNYEERGRHFKSLVRQLR